MNLFKGLKGVSNKMTANDLLVEPEVIFDENGKETSNSVVSTKQQHIN